LAAIAALAAAMSGAAHAAMYKWVDDQGVVHYSDKVPPEAVSKGATVLDKQGMPVKKIDPALTPEQIKAKEAADEEQRAKNKALADQARKDKALMQSYTTEQEIDVAKSRALATIDNQIKSAQAYSIDLTQRLEALKKRKAAFGGKPAPADVERDLNTIDVELARQQALIQQKTEEIGTVTAKYDTDKKRWQDIKADQQRAAMANGEIDVPKAPAPKTPAPTAKK
jgi:chromosome segregation ATPase